MPLRDTLATLAKTHARDLARTQRKWESYYARYASDEEVGVRFGETRVELTLTSGLRVIGSQMRKQPSLHNPWARPRPGHALPPPR